MNLVIVISFIRLRGGGVDTLCATYQKAGCLLPHTGVALHSQQKRLTDFQCQCTASCVDNYIMA